VRQSIVGQNSDRLSSCRIEHHNDTGACRCPLFAVPENPVATLRTKIESVIKLRAPRMKVHGARFQVNGYG
jgi:hypothetical protein